MSCRHHPIPAREATAPRWDSAAPVRPERWSSRAGFIVAAMGSAIGLGSIWKFPYEVGTNGGGAFVLRYVPPVGIVAASVARSSCAACHLTLQREGSDRRTIGCGRELVSRGGIEPPTP